MNMIHLLFLYKQKQNMINYQIYPHYRLVLKELRISPIETI